MELHFTTETEKKLKDLAAQSGHGGAEDLVQDLIEGYFGEVTQIRESLNGRHDELRSGRVKTIPGQEIAAHFRENSAAAPCPARLISGFDFDPEAPTDLGEICEFIGADSPDAADAIVSEILLCLKGLSHSRFKGTDVPTSLQKHCGSRSCANP